MDSSPPAFPRALAEHEQGQDPVHGMSLRDWFAGQALSGLARFSAEVSAHTAYQMADAMLAELAKAAR